MHSWKTEMEIGAGSGRSGLGLEVQTVFGQVVAIRGRYLLLPFVDGLVPVLKCCPRLLQLLNLHLGIPLSFWIVPALILILCPMHWDPHL